MTNSTTEIEQLQARITALEAENHALREFIRKAPGEHAIFDNKMHYIEATNNFRKGYAIEEQPYLGRSHYDIFPDFPQRLKDVHFRALAGSTETVNADGFTRSDGVTVYNKWVCSPWYTPENTIGGMLFYSNVVTDQVIATIDLEDMFNNVRESEVRFEMVLQNSPVTVFTMDDQLRYTWIRNPNSGLKPEEQIGKTDAEVFPEHLAKQLTEVKRVVLNTGQIQKTTLHIVGKHNGHERWANAIFEPIIDNDLNVVGVRGVSFDVTELTEAKAQLEESEARFRLTLENSRVTVFNQDAQLRYTWIRNSNSGLEPEEMVGKTDEEIFPAHLATELTEIKQHIMETGEQQQRTVIIESEYTDQSRWVDCTFAPIFDKDGQHVIGIRGVGVDVTELTEAQAQLAESEARFRLAVENSPVTIFNQDAQLRYTWIANPDAGLTAEEQLGKTDAEIFPERLAMELTSIKKRVIKTGQRQRTKVFVEFKNGFNSSRWFDSVFEPIFDDEQNVIGLRGLAFDVTDLIEIRKELAENEARFELTLQNSPVVVFTQDSDLRYTWIRNPGWGIDPNDLVGKRDDEIYPGHLARQLIEIKQQILETGEQQRSVLFMEQGDMSKWVDAVFEPIIGHDGKIIGIRGVATDITEIIESQQLLTKTVVRLEEANRELEQFAYIASHDLQEPLRMVTSYVELLKKRYQGQLDERADQYIHFAVDGAARMKLLIQDLLEVSRLNTQHNTLHEVHLLPLIEQAKQNLKQQIEETDAIITIDDMPTTMVDPRRIMQVFQNLISNAIKYQKLGNQPHVHISSQRIGNRWKISVKDNGIGIEAQYQDRVFAIFQRLHTQNEYSGTGIGLALCKKIITLHGGEIWFESKLNEGATFYFTLPKIESGAVYD